MLEFVSCEVELLNTSLTNSHSGLASLVSILSSRATLTQVAVENSFADTSSLVKILDNSHVTIYECHVVGSSGYSSLFDVRDNSTLLVDSCNFVSNHVEGDGSCFSVTNQSRLHITNSAFTNNSASGSGGVIFTNSQTTVTMETSTFDDNRAEFGFGGVIYGTNDVTLTATAHCAFRGNYAGIHGGVVAMETVSHVTLETSVFVTNRAFQSCGVILCWTHCRLNIINSNFTGEIEGGGGQRMRDPTDWRGPNPNSTGQTLQVGFHLCIN